MISLLAAFLLATVVVSTGLEELPDSAADAPVMNDEAGSLGRVLPSLPAEHEEVVGSLLSEYISADQFSIRDGVIERILASKELLAPGGRLDPIEVLMGQLVTEDRLAAVNHFIFYNQPELMMMRKRMEKTSDMIRLMSLRLKRQPAFLHVVASSLYDEVVTYVQNRVGRCMYDYVPMEFRDTSKYDEMFKELDGLSLGQSRPADIRGVLMYVDRDSVMGDVQARLYRDEITGVVALEKDDSTMFINTRCSSMMNVNFRNRFLYPGIRAMTDTDDETALIWRADSLNPISLSLPKHTRKEFLASNEAIYFAYDRMAWAEDIPVMSIAHSWPSPKGLDINLPGFLRGTGGDVATFKVSTNIKSPHSAEELEEVASIPGDTMHRRTLDLNFGTLYDWDELVLLESPTTNEFAVCFSYVGRFFDDLQVTRDKVEDDINWFYLVNQGLCEDRIQLMRYIFGLREEPRFERHIVTESQRRLANVHALVRDGKLLEAWCIVPVRWLKEWQRTFALWV